MCDGTEPTCGSNSLCHGCQEEYDSLRRNGQSFYDHRSLQRENITLKEELKVDIYSQQRQTSGCRHNSPPSKRH